MMKPTPFAIAIALLTVSASGVLAQTAPQNNPLRPSTNRTAPAPAATPQAAPTPAPQAAEETKNKRQRSPAQLANDNRMRACGQEWRANKAALQAQGKTWLTFSTECRARLKAQGR